MKKVLFLTCLAMLTAMSLQAQEFTVTYTSRLNTSNRNLFKTNAGLPEEMSKMLMNAFSSVKFEYRLTYKDGESALKYVPSKEKQEITIMGQKIDINALMGEQQKGNVLYKNHKTGVALQKLAVLGKEYLLTDDVNADTFNIVKGETKEILGFECKKAVSTNGKSTVWFTEYIPIKEGPVNANVNGLILEAETDEYIYMATNFSEQAEDTITRPTGGKEMTMAEFKQMIKKQTEMLMRGSNTGM